MVRPMDESLGSSPLQGHGSWLVCEWSGSHIEKYPSKQSQVPNAPNNGADNIE